MKTIKVILFLLLLFAFAAIIMLMFCLFDKSFNIAYIKWINGILFLLLILFIIKWEIYINNVEYTHLKKHQTENGCYKAAKPVESVQGIVISCTECNEPYLKRYIDFHSKLGFNYERNHWNVSSNVKMPHEFIGYDKNKEVVIINTLPYGYASFSCGCGIDGNYSFPLSNHIKICICKFDEQQNENYFDIAVRGAAVQLCSSLCKKYNLKPEKIIFDGEFDELICSKVNSNCMDWFSQNQYSIEKMRFEVKKRNTPIMLFSEDYLKVLERVKKWKDRLRLKGR